jgi:hypothetical protein
MEFQIFQKKANKTTFGASTYHEQFLPKYPKPADDTPF